MFKTTHIKLIEREKEIKSDAKRHLVKRHFEDKNSFFVFLTDFDNNIIYSVTEKETIYLSECLNLGINLGVENLSDEQKERALEDWKMENLGNSMELTENPIKKQK